MDLSEAHDRIIREVDEDLRSNPRYNLFWEKLKPDEKENFIEVYQQWKAQYLVYGKWCKDQMPSFIDKAKKLAVEFLEEILQKKLYDLELLWRAEKMEIPGIEITDDFTYWELNIDNCPFLEPITDEEYGAMLDFIKLYVRFNLDLSTSGWRSTLMSFCSEKNEDDDNDDEYGDEDYEPFLRWPSFYNQRFRIPDYKKFLKDIREAKETAYHPIQETSSTTIKDPQDLRGAFADTFEMEKLFIKQFENKHFQALREAYENFNEWTDTNANYEDALDVLRIFPRNIPVEENDNWEMGLVEAADKLWKAELFRAMDQTYREYKKTGKLNLPESRILEYIKQCNIEEKEFIIKTRIERGEPGDLNF
jgi:hypothetical protein